MMEKISRLNFLQINKIHFLQANVTIHGSSQTVEIEVVN